MRPRKQYSTDENDGTVFRWWFAVMYAIDGLGQFGGKKEESGEENGK